MTRMTAASSPSRYTAVAVALHWAIAAAILFQLGSGWVIAAAADEGGALTFALFQIHKTVGVAVLALTLARIAWRAAHPPPPPPAGMTALERGAAQAAHAALYALMLLTPLIGWAMVSVSPTQVPTLLLMLEALPYAHLPLAPDDPAAAEALLKTLHAVAGYAMGALALGHAAAALKHQVVSRDGLMRRMALRGAPRAARPAAGWAAAGLAALALAGPVVAGRALAPAPAAAPAPATRSLGDWRIDPEASTLGFVVDFGGAPVAGAFARWSADIVFEPDQLARSRAEVAIETASVSIDDPSLGGQATGEDGFASAAHPRAVFVADAFSTLEDGRFAADGALSLRGVEAPLRLVFSFEEADGAARVVGSAVVDRLVYGVGRSNAPDETWLKVPVEIRFDLTARRAAAETGG